MQSVSALNRLLIIMRADASRGPVGEGRIGPAWVLARDSRGAMLLETVVATMIFSLVGVAVLSGLSTAHSAGSKIEEQSLAENIARNQMEYTFAQPYQPPEQTPYPTYAPVPAGYGVDIIAEQVDPVDPKSDIERLTVTITRDGEDILVLKTLRFNEQ